MYCMCKSYPQVLQFPGNHGYSSSYVECYLFLLILIYNMIFWHDRHILILQLAKIALP